MEVFLNFNGGMDDFGKKVGKENEERVGIWREDRLKTYWKKNMK